MEQSNFSHVRQADQEQHAMKSPNSKFSMIHITDLHFGAKKGDKNRQLQLSNFILNDIEGLCNKGLGSPVALFVTGDLVSGVSKESRDLAKRREVNFLKTGKYNNSHKSSKIYKHSKSEVKSQFRCSLDWICGLAENLKIDKSNIFTVPGNHDVFWLDVSQEVLSMAVALPNILMGDASTSSKEQAYRVYKKLKELFDGDDHELESILSSQQIYREVVAEYLPHCTRRPSLSYRCIRKFGEALVQIDGVNTAWGCIARTNHLPSIPSCIASQFLAMDSSASNIARNQKGIATADVRIGLMHHPVGWLSVLERAEVKEMLVDKFELLFRGHEHVDWVNPWGAAHVEISSACGYEQRQHGEVGFSIVELDTQLMNGRVFMRTKTDRHDSYGAQRHKYTTGDGAWPLYLRKPLVGNDYVSSSALMRRIGMSAGLVRDVISGNAAVLVVDILDWSAIDAEKQQIVLDTLWRAASGEVQRVESADHTAVSTLSDGIVVGLHGDRKKCAIEAIVVSRALVAAIEQYGVQLRFGLKCGQVRVATEQPTGAAVIYGETFNIARRLAYISDAATLACETEDFSLINDAFASGRELELCKAISYEVHPIMWTRNSRPMVIHGIALNSHSLNGSQHLERCCKYTELLVSAMRSVSEELAQDWNIKAENIVTLAVRHDSRASQSYGLSADCKVMSLDFTDVGPQATLLIDGVSYSFISSLPAEGVGDSSVAIVVYVKSSSLPGDRGMVVSENKIQLHIEQISETMQFISAIHV